MAVKSSAVSISRGPSLASRIGGFFRGGGQATVGAAPVFRAPVGAGLTPQQQRQALATTGLRSAFQPAPTRTDVSPALRELSIQLAQPAAGQSTAVQPTAPAIVPPKEVAALPDNYQAAYNAAYQYLLQNFNKGQTINPGVEITPERAAEFLKIAENESDPYYATQFKLAREGFLKELGYAVEEIKRLELETERQHAKSLRGIAEQQAETGFALSGRRLQAEQELAQQTQREIEQRRRTLQFGAEKAAGKFAEAFGERGIKEIQTPALPETPQVKPGEEIFARGQGTLPLYQLSPEVFQGLVGEQEKERKLGIRSLAQYREELFRQGRTIPPLQQIRELKL